MTRCTQNPPANPHCLAVETEAQGDQSAVAARAEPEFESRGSCVPFARCSAASLPQKHGPVPRKAQ